MNINGYLWKIQFVNSENPVLKKPDGLYTLGATDRRTLTVYLSDKLTGALLKRVLAHEICHCYVFSYGLKWNTRNEEMLCDFVSRYAEEIVDNTNRYLQIISYKKPKSVLESTTGQCADFV